AWAGWGGRRAPGGCPPPALPGHTWTLLARAAAALPGGLSDRALSECREDSAGPERRLGAGVTGGNGQRSPGVPHATAGATGASTALPVGVLVHALRPYNDLTDAVPDRRFEGSRERHVQA